MVKLRTRKREMRGDRANHHDNLGLKRISCVSQSTMPDMADISSDMAGKYPDIRSSQPNQAYHSPGFSYPLVSSR